MWMWMWMVGVALLFFFMGLRILGRSIEQPPSFRDLFHSLSNKE